MNGFISNELAVRIDTFWKMVVANEVEREGSPYLNNLETHYIQARNAECEKEGGADAWAQSNSFENAEHMMLRVLEQAEEDYENRALDWAIRK